MASSVEIAPTMCWVFWCDWQWENSLRLGWTCLKLGVLYGYIKITINQTKLNMNNLHGDTLFLRVMEHQLILGSKGGFYHGYLGGNFGAIDPKACPHPHPPRYRGLVQFFLRALSGQDSSWYPRMVLKILFEHTHHLYKFHVYTLLCVYVNNTIYLYRHRCNSK